MNGVTLQWPGPCRDLATDTLEEFRGLTCSLILLPTFPLGHKESQQLCGLTVVDGGRAEAPLKLFGGDF